MEKIVTAAEIELANPVKFGEEIVDKISLRGPVAKDFRDLDATKPFAMMLDLAAVLSGLPNSVIDKLSAEDTMAVCDKVGGFLHASRKTGAT